jgi:hypothetical protein
MENTDASSPKLGTETKLRRLLDEVLSFEERNDQSLQAKQLRLLRKLSEMPKSEQPVA